MENRLRPLDGITVIALEHAIAAPFCTRQLADLGARVIKIERPGVGDFARGYDERVRGMTSHFVWCNRSKQSLTLDVKHPSAAKILTQLVGKSDVLVQNLAPGASARLGLSYEALKVKFPRLIVCDVSGYGADGPYRDKKAYDLLIQSESGFLSITGTPETPSKAGNSIADISAGMYAYSNILAALIQRGKTGQGCRLDISMLESMVEWMCFPLYYAFEGAPPPPRSGASHATIAPYGPFQAGDGKDGDAGSAKRTRMGCVLRAGVAAPGPRNGFAIFFQLPQNGCRPGTDSDHRGSIFPPLCGSCDGATRKGADRLCAREKYAGRVGAPTIAGAQPLDRSRIACWENPRSSSARNARGIFTAHGCDSRAGRAYCGDPPGAWL